MEHVTMSRSIPNRYKDQARVIASPYSPEKYYNSLAERVMNGIGVVIIGAATMERTKAMACIHNRVMNNFPSWGRKNAIWANSRDLAYQYEPNIIDEVFGDPCIDIYNECKWLTVNGLGKEVDFKNHVHRMNALIDRRIDNGVCTSFTTSLTPKKIAGLYGADFWEKLKEGCLILSEDKRKVQ